MRCRIVRLFRLTATIGHDTLARTMVVVAVISAMVALLNAVPLRAQDESPENERAPRFLLASAAEAGTPVRVDVSHTPVLRRRISVVFRNTTLEDALKTVEEQSGLNLAYSKTSVRLDRPVSLEAKDITVAAALTELLLDADVDVVFSTNGRAMLVRRNAPKPKVVADAVITGRVTTTAGTPVSGANVTVSSLRVGAVTNDAGYFRIVVPSANVTGGASELSVTRIGFRPTRVPFTLHEGAITVDVRLTELAISLNQVVVTGTAGSQERRAQGATIATVNANAITQVTPVSNFADVLQGQVPGVNITQANGTFGGPDVIRIRGVSSISLSNQPLIFVDGIRVDDRTLDPTQEGGGFSTLQNLPPEDIESIEVVKGPAAATLYGADASAGVIQIITKRGVPGVARFQQTVSGNLGTVQPNWTPPSNFARCISALTGPTSPNPLCRGQAAGTLISDNPLLRNDVLRDGSMSGLNWTGRGGGQGYGYYLSYGYTNNNGITPMDAFKQQSVRTNFNVQPRSTMSLDITAGFEQGTTHQSYNGNHPYSIDIGIISSPLTVGSGPDGWLFTPAVGLENIDNQFTNTRITPAVTAKYNPIPWFTNRLTLGADVSRISYEQFFPKNDQGWYAAYLSADNGRVQQDRDNHDIYTLDYLGNAKGTWGSTGQWVTNTSLGAQLISIRDDYTSAIGQGLINNATRAVGAGSSLTGGGSQYDQRSVGFIGQLEIAYRQKLYLQLGARADGNSAFGNASQYFFLPKAGLSYVASEEGWWKSHVPIANTFRLRAAYGTTGRSPTPGAALTTYGTSPFVIAPGTLGSGIVPLNPGNDSLKAERGIEFEGGFDAGFWGDRAGLEVTYFNKTTKDLLLRRPIPLSLGFTASPFANLGEVKNSGIEAALHVQLVNKTNFGWDARATVSTLHNELVSLGGVAPFVVGNNNENRYTPGEQLGAFYAYRIQRVDVANGVAIVSDSQEFAGNSLPTRTGTVSSTLTLWQHLHFTGLLDWSAGNKKFNTNAWYRDTQLRVSQLSQTPPPSPLTAQYLRIYGPFQTANGTPVSSGLLFDQYLENDAFARLRELSATIDLPARLVRHIGAGGGAFTVGGRNVALWTNYSGPDPEATSFVPETGIFENADFASLPQPRQIFARFTLQY